MAEKARFSIWRVLLLLLIFFLGIPMLLEGPHEVYLHLFVDPMENRIRSNYSKAKFLMRAFGEQLEADYQKRHAYIPGKPYWGLLTDELIRSAGGEPIIFVDPFHREAGRPSRHGAWLDASGLEYTYYTNGKDFWALVSPGPDEVVNVTSETLRKTSLITSSSLRMKEVDNLSYDPTNGTASQGDIVRFKE